MAIIPMGIAINLAIGLTVSALKLPIFLDSIGTVLFTIICGWRVGATVGVLSFLVGGIANPLLPYFVFTQFTIAWVAGLSASHQVKWYLIPLGTATPLKKFYRQNSMLISHLKIVLF